MLGQKGDKSRTIELGKELGLSLPFGRMSTQPHIEAMHTPTGSNHDKFNFGLGESLKLNLGEVVQASTARGSEHVSRPKRVTSFTINDNLGQNKSTNRSGHNTAGP